MARQEINEEKRFLSHFLFTKSFVHPSIYTFIYSIINSASRHKEHDYGRLRTELDSLCNQVLLVLQMGSGLQRTQQECHTHNLPHGPECRVHP
jgi:hypothetical protein